MEVQLFRLPFWGLFLFLLLLLLERSSGDSPVLPRTYPKKLHQRVLATLNRRRGGHHHDIGSWDSWSTWSPCSRSCGIGVSKQSRECVPQKRKRSRRVSNEIGGRCVGTYKRFQLCNTQDCLSNVNFRREQCTAFNKTPFDRRYYSWEPYFDGTDSCSLNCRPVGLSFYATLNQSVVDGTPCNAFERHKPTRICVEGRCMKVGCDGILGSGRVIDACGQCGGDNSTCRVISGVYSRTRLPFGYNLIATLPTSAENISIYHVSPSSNYLALREIGTGSYILNGPIGINASGRFTAAGSIFTYSGPQPYRGDHLFASDPLRQSIDVMLFYQASDPGIRYEYRLPADSPYEPTTRGRVLTSNPLNPIVPGGPASRTSPPGVVNDAISVSLSSPKKSSPFRNKENRKGKKEKTERGRKKNRNKKEKNSFDKKRRKRYMWTVRGFTPCSQTCGGGSQKTRIICVKRRKKDIEVPHSYCTGFAKPLEETVRCNLRPCPAEWFPGDWNACSVTCSIGFQTRTKTCRQKVSPDLTINVPEESCEKAPDVVEAQICQMKDCKGPPLWDLSPWSPCSSQCGLGTRERRATCSTVEGPVKESVCKEPKPMEEEICDMGSCASDTWFFSSWDPICWGPCGEGVQRRRVHCSGDALENQENASSCPKSAKPSNTKLCEVTAECGGSWFTGPWGECDAHCGSGQKRRAVVCVKWSRSRYKVTSDDSLCKASGERPKDSTPCHADCEAEWFTSEWYECSVTCDNGVQRREVKCLDNNQKPSLECSTATKPDSRQTCNDHHCDAPNDAPRSDDSQYLQKLPNDSSVPPPPSDAVTKKQNKLSTDACLDRMKNCHLVFKARLCKLRYYNTLCCDTCKGTP